MKSCASLVSLVGFAYRPDGSLDAPPIAGGYIRVSDDMGDSDTGNDKIRSLYFAPMGRITTARENGGINGATPCP